MTIMGRIAAQLNDAATNVPAEELRAAQDAIERLGADFHQAIGPIGPGDAESVLTELRQASQELSDALSQAQQVVNAIAAFTNHLGLAPIRRTLPRGAPAAFTAGAALPPSVSTNAPSATAFVPVKPDPAAVAEILPHVGRDVAVGRLYDRRGHALTPLVGPGDTGAGADLIEALASLRFVTHVESNATAKMRRETLHQTVLYLNMRPCLDDDGCTENIRVTLPEGSRLTVFQVRPSGGVRVWNFDGTGEGILPP